MPTKEFIITPGEAFPEILETALLQAFGASVVTKALQKGAKLKLTVTVPWPKPPKKEKVAIDDGFIAKLKETASDETQLETEIAKLSGPQILQIASFLGVPMTKTSKLQSLRAQLLKSLRSEIVWKGIAGQAL